MTRNRQPSRSRRSQEFAHGSANPLSNRGVPNYPPIGEWIWQGLSDVDTWVGPPSPCVQCSERNQGSDCRWRALPNILDYHHTRAPSGAPQTSLLVAARRPRNRAGGWWLSSVARPWMGSGWSGLVPCTFQSCESNKRVFTGGGLGGTEPPHLSGEERPQQATSSAADIEEGGLFRLG